MAPEQNQNFRLTLIADTGDRFSDFTPYVASLNDHGVVAFQAALRDGVTGIFTGDGGPVAAVADTAGGAFARFYSHPDIDNDGFLSVYAESRSGCQGVLVARAGQVRALADTTGAFVRIGPLGPTMNHRGTVAFRADAGSGAHGVFTATGAATGEGGAAVLDTIAETGCFRAFHGLPVIDGMGRVVFRADAAGGGQGIYRSPGRSPGASNGRSLHTVVDTSGMFAQLGAFPCVNDAGTVVFSAISKLGEPGIYAVSHGEVIPVVKAGDAFESFRGALVNNASTVIFYATPRGGRLGIYAARDAMIERLLALGDPMFGSKVADFALNPVSVNHVDQIAIRVELADARQVIVRADRVA